VNSRSDNTEADELAIGMDTARRERDALGDEQFRDELVAIIPQLRVFSRGLCSGRAIADDMVQDALTRAWAARKSFERGSNFRAWIFMILRNQYYTTVRKLSRMADWDPEAAERLLVTPADQEWQLEVAAVAAALQKLPPEQREVLLLVGASGLPYEEAAQIVGCAVGTIKSRLARGRIALKAIIEGEDVPMAEQPTARTRSQATQSRSVT
jgi:RNA polymerase sigma-70 factor (ECF subfamily)